MKHTSPAVSFISRTNVELPIPILRRFVDSVMKEESVKIMILETIVNQNIKKLEHSGLSLYFKRLAKESFV